MRDYRVALEASGFRGDVEDDIASRMVASTDNSIYQVRPSLVLYPRSAEDIERVVRTGASEPFRRLTFTARGGGTGTNGQALTDAVVVDTSRHMNRILDVDTERGIVRVQPGVVLAQLNERLAEDGLFFPPMISTASRATIGGMIGTDACGKGSRRYGRTHDYVESLDVALADGRLTTLRTLDSAEVDASDAASGDPARCLARTLRDRVAPHRSDITAAFPDMPRSLTGYNLRDAFPDDGSARLQHLVTGAEGTLALVREATLRVIPAPAERRMAVVRYEAFDQALADARALLATEPSAIETMDERIFALARQDPDWFDVREAMTGDEDEHAARVVNFVEYEGANAEEVDAALGRLSEALAHSGRSRGAWHTGDTDAMRRLWAVRARSVGLLARAPGARKHIPFIEDTVVPPDRLPEYIRDLRALLDREGIEYGLYGHVDVGCLHVRPALDMTDPDDARRVREITDEVVALLKRHKGLLWGEHGKGFRGEYTREFFGERLYPLLAEVKRAFDPDNRMNPGKIVAPDGNPDRIHRIDAVTRRGDRDAGIEPALRREWDKAIACNGNGACFDWDARQAICPSYRITRDRVHSPKGRATLLREWLRRGGAASNADDGFDAVVHEAMQGCLGCKACATQCPVQVDIPTMRARFLRVYHDRHRRRLRDHLAGRLEHLAPIFSRLAPVIDPLARSAPGRALMRRIGLVDLPELCRRDGLRRVAEGGVPVVAPNAVADLPEAVRQTAVFVRPDAFTTYFDPSLLPAVCRTIAALGFTPVVLDCTPTGKALHVHGFLDRFEAIAERERDRLRRVAAENRPLLALDPSTALLNRDEYPRAVADAVWALPRMLHEWLNDAELPAPPPERQDDEPYRLFLHCTERTAHPETGARWRAVFERLGLRLDIVAAGCCGMSGIYGHQCEHREHSEGLYTLSWRAVVESTARDRVLATGYSCRSQVLRLSGFRPAHPIEVVAEQLAECADR